MEKYPASVLLIVAACLFSCSASAQIAPQPAALSLTEQIRAARAKATREEAAEPTGRPWDRNANGKRPWEIKAETIK